ncbi:7-carboxy-7-deazaguanine synthase QueE [Spirosoma montaniterrae]|uniref:7-carboxy-7-deazaguanine synthase n=1 Tax=Spirosoma montaniterrae TaxID=1178516 RepID=A0A1P9WTG6_9BACT|nr:7-carboxy-7-deazaguanine synthase QueE [Spirosoma montaniterrae]AQG78667.1 7-carboxy-7-deazaguanine synthase [Spirosoma montaniterrae]
MVSEQQQQTRQTNTLPVMEAFYTLQGEGVHTGRAAYFIRLGGCDVGCHWCDVKESWDVNAHPHHTVDNIVAGALDYPGRLAVITGGEPLMHDLTNLTAALQTAGFQTNIETSGVCEAVTGSWDWICFSPKKFKKPNPAIFEQADELKVIVYNQSDFAFAESFVPFLRPGCTLFLQTEWSRSNEMLPRIVQYIKEHPQWQLSLQTHKYLDIP